MTKITQPDQNRDGDASTYFCVPVPSVGGLILKWGSNQRLNHFIVPVALVLQFWKTKFKLASKSNAATPEIWEMIPVLAMCLLPCSLSALILELVPN